MDIEWPFLLIIDDCKKKKYRWGDPYCNWLLISFSEGRCGDLRGLLR